MGTQRCLNDMFGGSCIGTPIISDTITIDGKEAGVVTRSKCSLDKNTCGFYKTFSAIVKPASNLGKARIVKKSEAAKPKSKSGKGFKQESLL